ncbi:hypothetical protein TNCV_2128651 [Trichonephila clavipes]|nr:hypothetical protein TNCV_2128651 [Trichonephila clavipes]
MFSNAYNSEDERYEYSRYTFLMLAEVMIMLIKLIPGEFKRNVDSEATKNRARMDYKQRKMTHQVKKEQSSWKTTSISGSATEHQRRRNHACAKCQIRENNIRPACQRLFEYKSECQSLVYADKPQTPDHLKDNIRRVIADIRPQMLEKVIENWTSRLDYIRASRGSHMPEIIFKM